jgi:hypothetical protein
MPSDSCQRAISQNWARAGSTLARYLADQDGRFSRQRRPSSTNVCCSMFECREWAASSYNGLDLDEVKDWLEERWQSRHR